MRFSGQFKPIARIPPPPVFQRVDKIYNSRLVGEYTLVLLPFIENNNALTGRLVIHYNYFSCQTPSP